MSAFRLTQQNRQSSRLVFAQQENPVQVTFPIPVNTKQGDSLLKTVIYNSVALAIFGCCGKAVDPQQHIETTRIHRHSHGDDRKRIEETAIFFRNMRMARMLNRSLHCFKRLLQEQLFLPSVPTTSLTHKQPKQLLLAPIHRKKQSLPFNSSFTPRTPHEKRLTKFNKRAATRRRSKKGPSGVPFSQRQSHF